MSADDRSLDERRRVSFDGHADRYEQVRPGYPEALIDDVVALSGIGAGGRMVEVGAGTGKATVLFARRGYRIVAVEPAANMARVLRSRVAPHDVEIVETRFEDWAGPGAPVRLVIAAQAFHWVQQDVRCTRAAGMLQPGGGLAILRNDKDDLDPDLRAGIDAAYLAHFPEVSSPPSRRDVAGSTEELDASGWFEALELRAYPWSATYTSAEYVALISTYSDHATLEDARARRLYDDIAAAIERHGGRLVMPYRAILSFGRRR